MNDEGADTQLETTEAAEAGDWKLKYFDSLQVLERREAEWGSLERILRNATSRMALALQGMDPSLDGQLEQLRAAIRAGDGDRTLEKLSRSITESLDRLETRAPEPEVGDGLFARLWGKRTYGERGAARSAGDDAAAAAFAQLLDQLDLAADDLSTRERVKQQLAASHPDWRSLSQTMADLLGRARQRLQQQKHEIEQYLLQLSQRLEGFDDLLQSMEANRIDADQENRELDESFNAQVRDMRSNVTGAVDLGQLKELVQNRLESLGGYVRTYLESQDSRSRAAQSRIEELSGKLATLETEASTLRSKVQQQHQAAQIDPLTGSYNRSAYEERVAQEFARWKRFGTPVSMAVLDIDNFKAINDRYGHQAGDKVLTTIASVLASNVRETDFLARYGGEEFVLIMPGAEAESGMRVLEKLRRAVQECGFHFRGEAVPVTVSCGIADFRDGDSSAETFARADRAMYKAKQGGRNRCELGID